MTDPEPYSAKGAARQLDTDARTLRKFLRSHASPFEAVGQGQRYVFNQEDFKLLRVSFNAWLQGEDPPEDIDQSDWYEGTDYTEDPF